MVAGENLCVFVGVVVVVVVGLKREKRIDTCIFLAFLFFSFL